MGPLFSNKPHTLLGDLGTMTHMTHKKGVKVANVQVAFRLHPGALYKESQILSEQNKPGGLMRKAEQCWKLEQSVSQGYPNVLYSLNLYSIVKSYNVG